MLEKTRVTKYEGAEITVRRASARIGIKRYLLASEGQKINENEPDEELRILRLILYPDLISATISATGIPWPISFEEFVDLDDDLMNAWADDVYKVNPTWRPVVQPEEEVKKVKASKKE
jgi:hypothetical protein